MYDFNTEKQEYTQAFYELMLSVLTSNGGNVDMSAPRLSLIASVRLKIDELQTASEGLEMAPRATNIIDMYINGILDESAKHILQIAPAHVIIPVEGRDAQVVQEGDSGHIILPDDYLRFSALLMQGWLQPVSTVYLTTDSLYTKQKYAPTRGGLAKPKVFATTKRFVNAQAMAQIDHTKITGDHGGHATLFVAGLSLSLWGTSPADAVTRFVSEHTAELDAEGVTLTDNGSDTLIFTATVAGTPFNSPMVVTLEGEIHGSTTHVQENVSSTETIRVLEYYSLPGIPTHTIEMFNYIGLAGAEHLQTNLHDALTWLCASKVLQIMSDANAPKAAEQVQLSFQNLL